MFNVVALICLVVLAPSSRASAQEIDSVAWMAGHWIGTGTDDLSEELWLPPASGAMVGVWRWASKGQVRLYEMLTISSSADRTRLELRLRHFRPDLAALEEKDAPFVLPLIKSGPAEAVFEGKGSDGGPLRITYRRPSSDRLEAELDKGGTTQRFTYRRKD
jgi:hypothetical protein